MASRQLSSGERECDSDGEKANYCESHRFLETSEKNLSILEQNRNKDEAGQSLELASLSEPPAVLPRIKEENRSELAGNSVGKLSRESRMKKSKCTYRPQRLYKRERDARVSPATFATTSRRYQRRQNAFRHRHRRFTPKIGTVMHIQYFYSFLYYIGMSPVKPKSAKTLPKWLLCLQAILYCLFTILSTIKMFDEVKIGWINFRAYEGMLSFVIFGFFVSNSLTRLYNIYLLFTSSTSTSNVLEKIEKTNTRGKPNIERNTAKLVVYAIVTISVTLAGLSTIFGDVAINNWTFNEAIKDRSYELSQSLFIWTASNYSTATNALFETYGKEVNFIVGIFATIGNVLCFLGTLHDCLILDLLPILTLQIYFLQKPFSSSIQRIRATKQAKKCHMSIYWEYYMDLRNISDDMDKVFGNQLKLIHIQNVLFFAYFLLRVLQKDPISVDLLIDFFCIVKVSIAYYFARKVGDENEKYVDFLMECSNRAPTIRINGKKVGVEVLKGDMIQHPIGIGRNEFFINEGFVFKFAGVVISSFLFLSGEFKV